MFSCLSKITCCCFSNQDIEPISDKNDFSADIENEEDIWSDGENDKSIKPAFDFTATYQPYQTKFNVRNVPSCEWSLLADQIAEWIIKAQTAYQIFHQDLTLPMPNYRLYLVPLKYDKAEMLVHAYTIAKIIHSKLKQTLMEIFTLNEVIIAEDQSNKVQAIAFIGQGTNDLNWLCSNPDHLIVHLSLNTSGSQLIRGASSAIILYLAQRALLHDVAISVRTIPISKIFYQKLQFESAKKKDAAIYILTSKKIKTLIQNQIPPFDQLHLK